MHHVKSAARGEAWGESTNPFARHHRPNIKRMSTASRTEEGRSNLYKTQSTPQGKALYENDIAPPPHSNTTPNANSRNHTQNAGGEMAAYSASPRTSSDDIRAQNSAYTQGRLNTDQTLVTDLPYTNEKKSTGFQTGTSAPSDEKNRHGLKKFFHKKEKKQEQETDDNGKEKPKFTFWGQLKATVFGSWINVLLIFSPIGIAVHFAKINPIAVFVINFIAIIPLAAMLSYATEEIALRTGEVIGGLLNASFGNAVELIVSIIALFQNQFLIVQTSLLGSMLSNLLLVMGMCFFFGGINRIEQAFNITVAQTASSLLFLAVASIIIPTTFEAWAQTSTTDRTSSGQALAPGVLELSRGTSVILLIIYACYLFFQLKSHVAMYTKAGDKNASRFTPEQKAAWKRRAGLKKIRAVAHRRGSAETPFPDSPTESNHSDQDDKDDEPEQPNLSLWFAVFTLLASTVLVALNAEFLVDSINAVTCSGSGISKTFVGLILLPIVGNAAEHATAVTVAIKDKMDLAIGVAVGSSMQIALLVLPLVIVIGWIAGKDGMTLYFDGFQLAMLFVSILLVNYLIQDGKSHWLEGVLLMMLYIIIATAAWFYPTDPAASGCES